MCSVHVVLLFHSCLKSTHTFTSSISSYLLCRHKEMADILTDHVSAEWVKMESQCHWIFESWAWRNTHHQCMLQSMIITTYLLHAGYVHLADIVVNHAVLAQFWMLPCHNYMWLPMIATEHPKECSSFTVQFFRWITFVGWSIHGLKMNLHLNHQHSIAKWDAYTPATTSCSVMDCHVNIVHFILTWFHLEFKSCFYNWLCHCRQSMKMHTTTFLTLLSSNMTSKMLQSAPNSDYWIWPINQMTAFTMM